jgi:hypothetical protein
MTNYRSLVGQKIKKVSSNPSDTLDGQVWYNTTEKKLKGLPQLQAWASTGPLSVARGFVGSTGTQAAALCIGGLTPAPTILSNVEEYNGAGWGAGGSLPAGTYGLGAAGTQTAALIFGGSTSSAKVANSYTYNGSSWTATPNSMNTARDQLVGGGTQTSALAVGGRESSAMVTNMEEWNGTSWSNLTAMSQARGYAMANGPETAFFIASGATGNNGGTPMTNLTEEYDGSSLSSGANVNTARSAGGAAGDSSAGLIWGGWTGASPGLVLNCEKYDGTSWSEIVDLATVKRGAGSGSGTSNTAAIAAGNYGPPATTTSEEFTQSGTVTTPAAWSSGGNMNTARGGTNGTSGDKSAGATFGGQTPGGRSNATELYDGSSWTNGTNTPAARRTYLVTGTQTASLLCGGQPPTPTANGDAETFEFDGSSFTDTGDINNARDNAAGAGTQTAGLAIGGRTRPGSTFVPNNNVEEYNGSSWSNANTLPAANSSSTSATGPQTAAIYALANPAYVASYDGTNWTAISATQAMPNSYTGTGVAGTSSSDAYMGGGEEPGGTRHGFVQNYDGTSWASSASFSTTRNSFGYNGSSPSQLICGGQAGPAGGFTNNTEEFSVETTALNVKTLTTS